jgi:hypothetical protein
VTSDASAPAPPCATEAEPNDDADEATPFTGCIAGTLATSKDKDHVRIVVPAGVETMTVENAANATDEKDERVQFRVSRVEPLGVPTPFTSESMSMKVKPGTAYVFQLAFARGGSKAARPYELRVVFE